MPEVAPTLECRSRKGLNNLSKNNDLLFHERERAIWGG